MSDILEHDMVVTYLEKRVDNLEQRCNAQAKLINDMKLINQKIASVVEKIAFDVSRRP